MWIRSDPDARETLQVIMKSAALSYANSKMLDFVATSIIEHQLRGQATKLMEYSAAPYSGADGRERVCC